MRRSEAEQVLGVRPGATLVEIEEGFRRCVKSAHPDHGGSESELRTTVEARFVLENAAARQRPPVTIVRTESWWERLWRIVIGRVVRRDRGERRVV